MSDVFIKICATALLCAVIGVVTRGFSGSIPVGVKIAGVIVIFSMVMVMAGDVIDSARGIVTKFEGYEWITKYWTLMLRALGIAILCRISSDVCRDCGENTLAGGVETAGKIVILALSLPIVEEILLYVETLISEL